MNQQIYGFNKVFVHPVPLGKLSLAGRPVWVSEYSHSLSIATIPTSSPHSGQGLEDKVELHHLTVLMWRGSRFSAACSFSWTRHDTRRLISVAHILLDLKHRLQRNSAMEEPQGEAGSVGFQEP